MRSSKTFLCLFFVVIPIALGVLWHYASHSLSIERIHIAIPDFDKTLPADLLKERLSNRSTKPAVLLKVTHLTDFHADTLPDHLVSRAIDASNAEDPDFVFLTGDFVSNEASPHIERLCEHLKRLKSKYGVYAVLGNHDEIRGRQRVIMENLRRIGIRVLNNEHVLPFKKLKQQQQQRQQQQSNNDKDLAIIGIGDYWGHNFRPENAFHGLDHDENATIRIVLSHNPDTAERMQHHKIDLQLSGHTHGGVVAIPFTRDLLPYKGKVVPLLYYHVRLENMPSFLAKLVAGWIRVVGGRRLCDARTRFTARSPENLPKGHWEWAEGLHYIPRTRRCIEGDKARRCENLLYTNRGLTIHPLRFFVPPELTVVTFTSSTETN